jgi:hypothetical protein
MILVLTAKKVVASYYKLKFRQDNQNLKLSKIIAT